MNYALDDNRNDLILESAVLDGLISLQLAVVSEIIQHLAGEDVYKRQSQSGLLLFPLLDAEQWAYAVLAVFSNCCPPL